MADYLGAPRRGRTLCNRGVVHIVCIVGHCIRCTRAPVLCQACGNMATADLRSVPGSVADICSAPLHLRLVIGPARDMVCTGQHTTAITKIGRTHSTITGLTG